MDRKQNIDDEGVERGRDLGDNPNKIFKFDSTSVRHQFIRKVYAIVFFQLLFTFGFLALILFITPVRQVAHQYWYLGFVFLLVALAVDLALVFGPESWRRTFPTNIILLSVFTVFEGLGIGWILAVGPDNVVDRYTVGLAFGLTMLIVFAFTAFAFQTKYDITSWGGTLCVLLLTLLIVSIGFSIFASLMPTQEATFWIIRIAISSVGILIFIGVLVFETQLLLGGNHEYAYSPEDYVMAAISIYLVIMNIFLRILALIVEARMFSNSGSN